MAGNRLQPDCVEFILKTNLFPTGAIVLCSIAMWGDLIMSFLFNKVQSKSDNMGSWRSRCINVSPGERECKNKRERESELPKTSMN